MNKEDIIDILIPTFITLLIALGVFYSAKYIDEVGLKTIIMHIWNGN